MGFNLRSDKMYREREVMAYNNYTFRHVVKDCRMCIWLLELLACWFLAFTAHWTFCFGIPFIGNEFDWHLLFELHSWAGSVELISSGFSLLAAMRFPRKKICLVAAAMCSVSCAITGLLRETAAMCSVSCAITGLLRERSLYVPLAVLALFAKLMLVVYTSTLQLMTLEMLPKEIRFNMMVVTVSVSYAAIAGSSVLALTAETLPFLPFMGCGAIALAIFGLTFLLPETFHRNLDEADHEQTVSIIEPPVDPVISGETSAAVEMIDLSAKVSLNESTAAENKEENYSG